MFQSGSSICQLYHAKNKSRFEKMMMIFFQLVYHAELNIIIVVDRKKSWKMPKGLSETGNQSRTDSPQV
jgi:hypothetical protein